MKLRGRFYKKRMHGNISSLGGMQGERTLGNSYKGYIDLGTSNWRLQLMTNKGQDHCEDEVWDSSPSLKS